MKRGFICSSWSYLCQIIFNEKDLTREARSLAPRLILTKLNASLSSTRQTFCTRGERRFAQFGFPLAQKRIDKYFPPLLRFTRHRKQFRKSWLAPFFFSLSFLHFSFLLFFFFISFALYLSCSFSLYYFNYRRFNNHPFCNRVTRHSAF